MEFSDIFKFGRCILSLFLLAISSHATSQDSKSNGVKLVETSQKIEVKTETGDMSLPKYKKVQDREISISDFYVDNLSMRDISIQSIMLKEQLILKMELKELSSRLGIEIESEEYLELYRELANWLGTKYKRGGMNSTSVDCSGFTNLIYKSVFNTQLPRVSTEIAKNVTQSIDKKENLQPGDMVFFSTFGKKYINHVGVYIGEGLFVHASIKRGVIVSSLIEGYYSKNWRKGGRME